MGLVGARKSPVPRLDWEERCHRSARSVCTRCNGPLRRVVCQHACPAAFAMHGAHRPVGMQRVGSVDGCRRLGRGGGRGGGAENHACVDGLLECSAHTVGGMRIAVNFCLSALRMRDRRRAEGSMTSSQAAHGFQRALHVISTLCTFRLPSAARLPAQVSSPRSAEGGCTRPAVLF